MNGVTEFEPKSDAHVASCEVLYTSIIGTIKVKQNSNESFNRVDLKLNQK